MPLYLIIASIQNNMRKTIITAVIGIASLHALGQSKPLLGFTETGSAK